MRRKIKIADLRLGMYVDKLVGNWLDHPFWRNAFSLNAAEDLSAIRDSGIREVWIDTSKGLDVETVSPAQTAEVTAPIVPETATPEPGLPTTVPLEDELESAQQTIDRARETVISLFQEARMGHSINVTEAAPLVEEISRSVARNPAAMLSLTRMKDRDNYTYMHSVAVCGLMIALGRQLDYPGDIQSLGMAGLLHDVGKMAIPEDVLNKPGRLTDDEFVIVRKHPHQGWEMLSDTCDVDEITLDVCLHHHERMDGRGYPDGLAGDTISLVARMGAVCDVYDAITSDRCYKKGWEPAEALKKMAEWKDGHFDETVFHAFVKTIGIYPTGTLVKLHSGRLAVVTEQSAKNLLTPVIKVFYSCNSLAPIPPRVIDLARSGETIESVEKPETWGMDRARIMALL